MVATLYLFACALATAQPAPPDASEWQLLPRLGRGQEIVYRGTYTEEANTPGVQFSRSYRLEQRVFILETPPQGYDVAFFTVWKGRSSKPEVNSEYQTNSVRLELARLDGQGRVSPSGTASLLAPLEGPPTIECGAFVEVPRWRLSANKTWEVTEEGRPARTWHATGMEAVNGTRCVKLIGVQQSEDWDKPRADRTAWRRQDTVWMAPRSGFAYKVERVIERREPARREPSERAVVKYELESTMQYPGQLYEDRRREITQAQAFNDSLAPLLPRAAQVGPRQFETILGRINLFLNSQPPTPYRDAVKHAQHLAEAGKRGESPPEALSPEAAPVAQIIAPGKKAPDFLATDLVTKESARLKSWLGKPILLVFYNPSTRLGEDVLRFAQKLNDAEGGKVNVVGMAVTEDTERVLKQRKDMNLTLPILSGTGLRLSYAVEATPKLIVLDPAGMVRGSYIGWGPETPSSVADDLKHCQPR